MSTNDPRNKPPSDTGTCCSSDVDDCCCCVCNDPYEVIRRDLDDPWKHRSEGMRCSTCMWFVDKEGQDTTDARGNVGRCRRHSPTISGFPVVFSTDWCGDHRLDETKL